jgi:voltage-gated potassium channel
MTLMNDSRGGGGRRRNPPEERPNLGVKIGWKTLTWALFESLLSVALLVTAYFVLPLDGPLDGDGIGWLIFGLIIFGFTVGWQIRAIFQAKYPVLQAIRALAIAVPLFLLIFSALYFELGRSHGRVFNEPMSKVDAIYFTVTVFATVGFGDIVPLTQTARVVVTLQMLGDLIVLGVLLRSIVSAARVTRAHRVETSQQTADPPVTPQTS